MGWWGVVILEEGVVRITRISIKKLACLPFHASLMKNNSDDGFFLLVPLSKYGTTSAPCKKKKKELCHNEILPAVH